LPRNRKPNMHRGNFKEKIMVPLSIYASKLKAIFNMVGLTSTEQSFVDNYWLATERSTKMEVLDLKALENINSIFNKYYKD